METGRDIFRPTFTFLERHSWLHNAGGALRRTPLAVTGYPVRLRHPCSSALLPRPARSLSFSHSRSRSLFIDFPPIRCSLVFPFLWLVLASHNYHKLAKVMSRSPYTSTEQIKKNVYITSCSNTTLYSVEKG